MINRMFKTDRKLFKKILLKYTWNSSSSVLLLSGEKEILFLRETFRYVMDAVLFCLPYPKLHVSVL